MNQGDVIEGKYEILFKLSEGGMGEVYKVRHLLLDEVFVIKKIRAQLTGDENLRQRFHREARTAIRLKHPNIAGIQDFFVDDEGTAYLAMEFIEGVTLKEILGRPGLPSVGLTLEMARQTLQALSFLHGRGFLHRDISPDNLMLTRNFDGKPLVKLLDLGLARSLGGGGDLTTTGMFLGKARYSAPEQLSGKSDLDETSDLYAFGVTLYEMLTGYPPIDGKDFSALIAGHLLRPPRDFAETDPGGRVPGALRRIVLKTLEKEVGQRFGSAEEVLTQVQTIPADPWPPEEVERFFAASGAAPASPPVSMEETTATRLLARQGAAAAGSKAVARAETDLSAPEIALAETEVLTGRDRAEAAQKPHPRRLWRAVLACVVLLGGALGWYVLKAPAPQLTVAENQAQEAYLVGLEAFEQKDWNRALSSLRRALHLDRKERLDVAWADPAGRGRPYLPRFYLGAVLAEQGNCVKAFEAFEESKHQAVVQQTPQGSVLDQYFTSCEQTTAKALELLRARLATVGELVTPLTAALAEESFWRGDKELRMEVEGALADFSELRTRFDAAAKRSDYGTLFGLEQALFDAQAHLVKLAEELGAGAEGSG